MKYLLLVLAVMLWLEVKSQDLDLPNSHDFDVFQNEWGISLGGVQYFGDLNIFYDYLSPNYSIGIFLKNYFNPYVGYRLQANYSFISGNDNKSSNAVNQQRNLNFSSRVYEAFACLDINFFRYTPQGYFSSFTPYLTFGLGGIYFDTYTRYQNTTYRLAKVGTEASGNYIPFTAVIPIGFGLKFNLSKKINLEIEALHRFTFTDKLDDVSNKYLGSNAFVGNDVGLALQDRSNENGSTAIGIQDRQRGNSSALDQFQSINIKLSFNIYKYTCP